MERLRKSELVAEGAMRTRCFRNEWEYLDARFKVIDILKDWEEKEQEKGGSTKKDSKTRDFRKEIRSANDELILRHNASVRGGLKFVFDEICDTAKLDLDERLILAFLLNERFGAAGGKAPYQEIMNIVFRDRKKRLTRLRCLAADERLIRSGLITQEGSDYLIAERVYSRFLKIGKKTGSQAKLVSVEREHSERGDLVKAMLRLADLMWERAQLIDCVSIHLNNKVEQDDLDVLNARITDTRAFIDKMALADNAASTSFVRMAKKYELLFDEQMVIIALMQSALNLSPKMSKAPDSRRGAFKVMEFSEFLAPSRGERPRYFRYFMEDSRLISLGILEGEKWRSRDALQTKEFCLAGEVLDYLIGAEEGAVGGGLDELEAKLQNRAAQSGKVAQPRFALDDLVLGDFKKMRLMNALAQYKNRDLIFKEWGFAEKIKYGAGLTMLFAGPPGTGKTLAAEAIAGHLGKGLISIDYSQLISAWHGDTEKNIAKAFRLAEEKGAVLLFDEADAVLNSRANAVRSWEISEVNTLLREIEKFKGVLVLTTNRHDALDPALERRIAFRLQFDPPGTSERLHLWKRHFPDKAPLAEDVDFDRLACEHTLTGAQIKNIALGAANRAAYRSSGGEVAVITRNDIKGAIDDEKSLCWSMGSKERIGFTA